MLNLSRNAWSVYRGMLDLLLPPRCSKCDRVGTWLCADCVQDMLIFRGPICSRCGRPWPKSGLCPACRKAPLRVAPLRSAFLFEGEIREALHALKYRGGREVARALGGRMAEAWREQALESEVLVPVPLYPEREMRRGYNQAALLAEALGAQIGMPVATRALQRVRNTPSQTKLNRQERKANVLGAFACAEAVEFAGRQVTLIDDVATTGATLDACAAVLLAVGAKAVNAFTLARAP